MSDKKYLLFSAIGFNDPAGFELDPNYIKNKINEYFTNKTIEKKYDKKAILSNLHNKVKIYSEGSMLFIVRKFKPEKVMLFFTKDMYERNIEGKTIEEFLKGEIINIHPKCKDISIMKSTIIANSFDEDLVDHNGKKFNEMIDKLKEGYEDYEILINITSATNQIKTKLALECIYNQENNIKAIYVSPPHGKKEDNEEDKKEDKKKDNEEDRKWIFDKYEQLRLEMKDTKYKHPDFKIFVALKIKNQISALLEKSYEYKACYDLFQNDNFINNNCKDVLKLLKYADLRSNLQYKYYDLVTNNIDPNSDCLKEFFGNEDILIEYFYIMKLKQQKGDLSDFVLRLEPFLDFIYDKKNNLFNKTSSNYSDIMDYKSKLELIRYNLRNTVAHQMVNVSEDNIKEKSGISSEDIINKCGELLELIYGGNFNKEYFVYDEINKKILEKI